MFDETKVTILNVPHWEAVFRAEIRPGAIAFVAVHDTTRGPGLGGCRMNLYANESEALTDVLRLSRGMTFKNAISDLPTGGGKALIACDPRIAGEERVKLMEEFGKFVAWINRDGNRYCTAEDMNTTVADLTVAKRFAEATFGVAMDPSPFTAWGVLEAIKFTVNYFADDLFGGNGGLRGKRVLVQGVGKVGGQLCEYLHDEGASLLVADVYQPSIDRVLARCPGATVVPNDNLFARDVDIFAPCAGGEVVTGDNLDQLNFKIMCGAANNQLQNMGIGGKLQEKGIVYCPDYVANMGGVCAIQYIETDMMDDEQTRRKITETVNRSLELTYSTGFKGNMTFGEAVDHAVKEMVWPQESDLQAKNEDLFPKTSQK